MSSKFAIKNILAVSSIFLLSVFSTTASAIVYPVSTSQTSCTLLQRAAGQCSIEVEGVLKGLGNTTASPTAFRASILIQEGFVIFQNPAGKSNVAQGVPFANVLVELSGSDLIEADQISRNGRALSDILFHDDDLIEAIITALDAACTGGNQSACDSLAEIQTQIAKNPNWIKWAIITKLQVLGQQFVQSLPNCNISAALVSNDFSGCLPPEDALGNKCVAPQAVLANPKNFIGQAFNYSCDEACHDKTGPTCPTSLPLP